jgi:hypothetical protein
MRFMSILDAWSDRIFLIPAGPFSSKRNYSAAIHQDGEKPVLFVPYFFRKKASNLSSEKK